MTVSPTATMMLLCLLVIAFHTWLLGSWGWVPEVPGCVCV